MSYRFTHTLDLCFSVYSDQEHWEDVPAHHVLAALRDRVDDLLRQKESHAMEAFGLIDTEDNAGAFDV